MLGDGAKAHAAPQQPLILGLSSTAHLLLPVLAQVSNAVKSIGCTRTASQSLQAMQRSSPVGYRRSTCSPRKRGLIAVFSNG